MVLGALEIYGHELIDFGAGEGRVLLASLAKGAVRAVGYELPSNQAHQFVFASVLSKVCGDAQSRAQWISKDISERKLSFVCLHCSRLQPAAKCHTKGANTLTVPSQAEVAAGQRRPEEMLTRKKEQTGRHQ